jgi:hypothetical protein
MPKVRRLAHTRGTVADMSYDLAVWVGTRPTSDDDAAEVYERLMDQMEAEAGDAAPPSAAIRAYVDGLLARWPDITEESGEGSPWADGPLIENAFGDAIFFSLVWSQAEEASDFAARLAAQHRLVCYDPQLEVLRPSPTDGGSRRSFFRRR